MKYLYSVIFLLFAVGIYSQKKVLDHKDFEIWNTIENEAIAPDGAHIIYSLEKGEKDKTLKIVSKKGTEIFSHPRVQKSAFTYDSKFVIFSINAWKDSIVELKRKKTKKDKLPKDTLSIYNLKDQSLVKIANVKSFSIPEKWDGYIGYLLEPESKKKIEKGEKESKEKSKEKGKKVDKENGYHLVIRNLDSKAQDTIKFVTGFKFSKESKTLVYSTSGSTKNRPSGVFVLDLDKNITKKIFEIEKGKYKQLNISNSGLKVGFIVDSDSTKVQERPNTLYTWKQGQSAAQKVVDNSSAPAGYVVSAHGKLRFSDDESKLYFGLAKPAIVKDTTLIDEEIVNVEVWTYNEPQLYTVQEMRVKRERERAYQTVIHLNNNNNLVQIGTKEYPNTTLGSKGDANIALVSTSKPYQLQQQWTASAKYNYAFVNVLTGQTTEVLTGIPARVGLSPNSKYAYGYDMNKSEWFTVEVGTKTYKTITNDSRFYNELNDSPKQPSPYGLAGWTTNDETLLLNDRYDIWSFDPISGENQNLTNGREDRITHRYIKLDKEEIAIETDSKWFLSTFDNNSKQSGYFEYDTKKGKGKQLVKGPFSYSRPVKAEKSDVILFNRTSFQEFPNLRVSDLKFKEETILSNANPQQDEYNWGTIELVKWTSLDGDKLEGMLVKPENFDPSKKYPMIVNFYERSSDRLFRHHNPYPGRSTINYSFYASRGYLIFNPDVKYKIGKPGESAYNCVIPGVEALIAEGFVDAENIGVQGHSWGGYQIAHLVTKSDIFKAAESGAPVPNMISAYGGIRWATGLSRQFQYEHTQSRLGATLWEDRDAYIENSPIFTLDKVNTPLLIMHNDADGHVPWYQGIEFFVALRRLGKPSWFLNYNGEPHWPLKLQNRKDFNIRMAQFFDHYLQGAGKPAWMKRGVPAIEKGINQGYELIDNED